MHYFARNWLLNLAKYLKGVVKSNFLSFFENDPFIAFICTKLYKISNTVKKFIRSEDQN